jgi:hypothetical protein
MPGRGQASDEERLPWLEPYRDPATTKAKPRAVAPPPVEGKRRGAGLLVGSMAALAAALSAGYWIGQREAASPPPPAPTVVVADKPAIAPPAPTIATPVASLAAPETAPVQIQQAPKPRPVVRKAASKSHSPYRQRKIRSAGIESDHLKAVRAAQERKTPPKPVVHRNWPKMPSPGPAGQVIQLGAFTTPYRAHAAYRQRLARYPLLGSMPRVVVPVITRPRGQILYVLRLGTTSRQQSATVCRNLRASGDHCLVIG